MMTKCTYRSIPLTCIVFWTLATSLHAGIDVSTIQKQSSADKSIAILIGVAGLQAKRLPPLSGVKADLKVMVQTLQNHCGCKRIITISDDDKGRGTYDDIMTRLRAALIEADKGKYDTVWVYFTGHATKLLDGRLVLAPTDCDHKRLGLTSIPADLISQLLADCNCKHRYLVLDCVCAGAASAKKGVCIMASSQANQPSYLSPSKKGEKTPSKLPSMFTTWLCRGLGGEADLDKNKKVSLNELAAFVTVHVAEEVANKFSNSQTPLFSQSDSTIVSIPTGKAAQRQTDLSEKTLTK